VLDHPRFRALALLGRLLLVRVDSVVMQASEKPQQIQLSQPAPGNCPRASAYPRGPDPVAAEAPISGLCLPSARFESFLEERDGSQMRNSLRSWPEAGAAGGGERKNGRCRDEGEQELTASSRGAPLAGRGWAG